MARLPRLIIPAQPHHLVQRGNNNDTVFRDADDHLFFLGWLRAAARQYKVAVHAFALLPSQIQLLVTPSDETGLGQMMQWIGRHYVPYFNQKYGRSGTLWNGRYKTALIDADQYLMSCSRYIESEAVRLGLAGQAGDYPWSSYAHHVGAKPDGLITDHAKYWALGNTPFQREAAYLELSSHGLSSKERLAIEETVLRGWPLGSERFKTELQAKAKRQVLPAKRGRPFKIKPADTGAADEN